MKRFLVLVVAATLQGCGLAPTTIAGLAAGAGGMGGGLLGGLWGNQSTPMHGAGVAAEVADIQIATQSIQLLKMQLDGQPLPLPMIPPIPAPAPMPAPTPQQPPPIIVTPPPVVVTVPPVQSPNGPIVTPNVRQHRAPTMGSGGSPISMVDPQMNQIIDALYQKTRYELAASVLHQ